MQLIRLYRVREESYPILRNGKRNYFLRNLEVSSGSDRQISASACPPQRPVHHGISEVGIQNKTPAGIAVTAGAI